MSDTGSTPGSGSAPFKTYQMSLRWAKSEAAEAREVVEALDMIEETILRWWQMSVLSRRDFTHQTLLNWQEEALERIHSTKNLLSSGEKSRIFEANEVIEGVYSQVQDAEATLREELEEAKTDFNEVKKKIKKLEDSIEEVKEKHKEINDKVKDVRSSRVIKGTIKFCVSLAALLLFVTDGFSSTDFFHMRISSQLMIAIVFCIFFYTISYVFVEAVYPSNKYESRIEEYREKINKNENELSRHRKKLENLRSKKDKMYNQVRIIDENMKMLSKNAPN